MVVKIKHLPLLVLIALRIALLFCIPTTKLYLFFLFVQGRSFEKLPYVRRVLADYFLRISSEETVRYLGTYSSKQTILIPAN